MKKLYFVFKILILIILLLTIFILLIYFFNNKNKKTENIEKENIIVSSITESQRQFVSDYLKNNISQLSQEKEVLGGKFYITKIDFLDNNNAIIEYEDGHIALKAKVNFEIVNSNIKILGFNIIK